MQHISLPEDYSLVLQEVGDHGEEELTELAESLSFEKGRLQHIILALQHKGLVILNRSMGHGVWIRLSSKGRKFMSNLWPESNPGLSYGY
jgi:DNA-binding MarR family transcriptional regulator